LLATAAAAALVCGLAGSASAFDVVDWSWDKEIIETVTIDITIEERIRPTGVVEIEKLQMHFGDINSFAKVFGIENNPPIEGELTGEPFQLQTTVSGNIKWETGGDPALNGIVSGSYNPANPAFAVTHIPGGNADESEGVDGNDADFAFGVVVTINPEDIPFELLAGDAIDGLALPEVINAATSVANNQQIYSTSALMLHDAQIAAGDINPIGGEAGEPNPIAFLIAAYLVTEVDDELEGINVHTDLAVLTILGAATGFIEPADIDADAWAFFITNASVDNSATAVGNNASYEINTENAANATMMADLTQLLIGDVNAVALAGGISVSNYDLSTFEGPLVQNVATAVGNNLNIRVDGCGGCDPGTGGGSNTD
jgi:hypothetical protein